MNCSKTTVRALSNTPLVPLLSVGTRGWTCVLWIVVVFLQTIDPSMLPRLKRGASSLSRPDGQIDNTCWGCITRTKESFESNRVFKRSKKGRGTSCDVGPDFRRHVAYILCDFMNTSARIYIDSLSPKLVQNPYVSSGYFCAVAVLT